MNRIFLAAALTAGGAWTPIEAATQRAASTAQQVPSLSPLLACRSETDDQARLRCFDAAAAAVAQATESGTLVVVNREEVRRTRRSLSGFNLPRLPFFSGDRSQEEEEPQQAEGVVASASETGYRRWLVTLEGGATWQTTEPESMLPLPVKGQKVRIRRGLLNSYFLSVAGQRGIRAMRVR